MAQNNTNSNQRNTSNDQNIQNQIPNAETEQPLKKDGTPDHRYKGQREGADEEQIANPDYTKAETGGTDENGRHVTQDGKPDRRFIENRTMTEEEAKVEQAQNFIAQNGQTTAQPNGQQIPANQGQQNTSKR